MPHPKVKIADNSGNEVRVTSNALDVNIAGSASIDIGDVEITGHGTMGNFSLEVRDSGNGGPTQLTGVVGVKHIDIMANLSNTGIIYIGVSSVTAAKGIALYAGDVYSLQVTNTNKIYALATVDQEDINIVYYG